MLLSPKTCAGTAITAGGGGGAGGEAAVAIKIEQMWLNLPLGNEKILKMLKSLAQDR